MARISKALALALVFCVAVAFGDASASDDTPAPYVTPKPNGTVIFFESFDDDSWESRWVKSETEKYANMEIAIEEPADVVGIPGDKGMVFKKEAAHYGISGVFEETYIPKGKTTVIQYEVQLQEGLSCGGAYVKLIGQKPRYEAKNLEPDTGYAVMFGPDRCGVGNDKVHFILRHHSLFDGTPEEKHLISPPRTKGDAASHLYTLIIRPDNTFSVLVDLEEEASGSLHEEFDPPVNPPKEIDDPEDSKPEDWVDDEYIPDPDDVKPEEWDEDAPMYIVDPDDTKPEGWLDDEPEYIPDPDAAMPEEWDEEMDGDWEPPLVYNPKCEEFGCGEWEPAMILNENYYGPWEPEMIENPDYIGEWKPRQIPNPKYFEDPSPSDLFDVGSLAIEIWTMSPNILFDNFLVTNDEEAAREFAEQTWRVKYEVQKTLVDVEDDEEAVDISAMIADYIDALSQDPTLAVITAVAAVVPLVLSYFVCCSGGDEEPRRPRRRMAAPGTKPSGDGDDDDIGELDVGDDVDGEEGEEGEEGSDADPAAEIPTESKDAKTSATSATKRKRSRRND